MSNFPIHINRQELEKWHEFSKAAGFDSTAAFVRMAVREKMRRDSIIESLNLRMQEEKDNGQ